MGHSLPPSTAQPTSFREPPCTFRRENLAIYRFDARGVHSSVAYGHRLAIMYACTYSMY